MVVASRAGADALAVPAGRGGGDHPDLHRAGGRLGRCGTHQARRGLEDLAQRALGWGQWWGCRQRRRGGMHLRQRQRGDPSGVRRCLLQAVELGAQLGLVGLQAPDLQGVFLAQGLEGDVVGSRLLGGAHRAELGGEPADGLLGLAHALREGLDPHAARVAVGEQVADQLLAPIRRVAWGGVAEQDHGAREHQHARPRGGEHGPLAHRRREVADQVLDAHRWRPRREGRSRRSRSASRGRIAT